jgi:PHP family Zn ribbon phosphoesterase
LDDIFDKDNGVFGQVLVRLKELSKVTVSEVLTWIQSYKPEYLDQMIPNAMIMSMALRKGVNPMNADIFKELGKETATVVEKYKKDFGAMLTDPDFVEMLEDDYGYDPVDPKLASKGRPNATTRNMI